MKAAELFNYIKSIKDYTTSGDSVDWTVKIDYEKKHIVLIFEESSQKRDWINNFNFPVKLYKKQESCLKVARGWGNAYKSCNDEIMHVLINVITVNIGFEVDICGWSYGGAISILAAEDLFYRTGFRANVYTFGAPKPLWGKKCQKYVLSCVNKVEQYAHINDCVPLMPPLPGYKMLNKVKVGKDFSLLKLFKPNIYHCVYGDESIYN